MGLKDPAGSRNESGQTLTEYVLLVAILITGFVALSAGMNRMGLTEKLMRPISQDFAQSYRYGHPKAKGSDDGGPYKHPRARGKESFRIFIYSGK